jgi:glycosyltransferase involved in cell wall biosynthesis
LLELLACGVLATGASLSLYKFMTDRVFDRSAAVCEPPFTTVMMCALNEEGFIEKALKSLEDQNIVSRYPANFEFMLVDSNSEDDTAAIAKDYGWTIQQASRGKLNARHLGIEKAKGDVIVSVDADTFYPPNWLNLVLRWFQKSDVVGVITPRLVDPQENILATHLSVLMSLIDVGPLLAGGMRAPGQSVAFYKGAYFDSGGFNLNINQLNVHEMVREEEIRFAFKLRKLGHVPVEWQAPCFTSLRRVMFLGKGKQYEKFTRERASGHRF